MPRTRAAAGEKPRNKGRFTGRCSSILHDDSVDCKLIKITDYVKRKPRKNIDELITKGIIKRNATYICECCIGIPKDNEDYQNKSLDSYSPNHNVEDEGHADIDYDFSHIGTVLARDIKLDISVLYNDVTLTN